MSFFSGPITGGPLFAGRTDPKGAKAGLDFNSLKALWEKHATGPAAGAGVSTVAAAIALAESGGLAIINSIGATGYWQIHPGGQQYLDPDNNAAAAVAKFNAAVAAGRDGFSPWTTYTGADTPGHEKTYLKYLPKSGIPGSAIPGAAKGAYDAGKSVVDGAQAIGDFLGRLTDGSLWLRIGLIVGGILCMTLGLIFVGLQFSEKVPMPPIPIPV